MTRNEFLSGIIRGLAEGNASQAVNDPSVSELSKNHTCCQVSLSQTLCEFENRVGGKFVLKHCGGSRSVIWGIQCPFGDAVVGRPHLCQITHSFFETISSQHCPNSKIKIEKSIARGDEKCIISILFD